MPLNENVPPGLPLQFVDALVQANRDFELLYLHNKNHPESGRSAYSIRRTWDFFVRHLLGEEPPAPVAVREEVKVTRATQ